MLPNKKINAIANGVLLIGIGVVIFFGYWWPWIIFVIGLSIAIRQFLSGRKTDLIITLSLLAFLALLTLINMAPSLVLSILFILLGIYVICREYFVTEINKDRK